MIAWPDLEAALQGRPGWRRVGREYHGPCPVSGAGRDCCFASEGRAGDVKLGCRKCGGNGGRLDSESLIAHLAALGGETARHVAAHATNDRAAIETPSPLPARARDDPALLADVLCRTVARKLETGVQLATELHELWGAEDHREVAGLATLPVLKRFPPAETDAALQALCWSLHAALAGRDWTEVGRVVAERLDRGGQSPGERSCWLMAGFFMDPERWRDDLQFLTEDEVSLKWLGMFQGWRRPPGAAVSRDDLAQAADGLHPAEDLFHEFSFPLTHVIARMPRGPTVDRSSP